MSADYQRVAIGDETYVNLAESFAKTDKVNKKCISTVEEVFKQVTEALTQWDSGGILHLDYRIKFGTDNLKESGRCLSCCCGAFNSTATRRIFPRLKYEISSFWTTNSLGAPETVTRLDYRRFEKECFLTIANKIKGMLDDKFKGFETATLETTVEFRGAFSDERDNYLCLKKIACAMTIFGLLCVNEASQDDGEALIHIQKV